MDEGKTLFDSLPVDEENVTITNHEDVEYVWLYKYNNMVKLLKKSD